MSSDPLVWLNESLLAFGSVYAVIFAALVVVLVGVRGSRPRVRALTTLSSATLRRDRLRLVLPMATVAFLGIAAGIANSASVAATEPLEVALARVSSAGSFAVVQHSEYVLNNHGGIPWESVQAIQAADDLGVVVPVSVALGSVSDEAGELLAPSAAIVLVSDTLGMVPPHTARSRGCSQIPVVIGSEAGMSVGDSLVVDGRSVVVSGVEPVYGGLGRLLIIGTHEQLGECAFPEATVSMLLIEADQVEAVGNRLVAADVQHEIIGTDQLLAMYDEFWLGTVAPPQMNLFFQVFLVAVVGSIYVSRTRSLQLQEIRAALSARGVQLPSLAAVTALGTAVDTAIASVLAFVPFVLLTLATNATQIGIELPIGIRSFGAGLLAGHVVVALGWLLGDVPVLRRLDIGAELRKVL